MAEIRICLPSLHFYEGLSDFSAFRDNVLTVSGSRLTHHFLGYFEIKGGSLGGDQFVVTLDHFEIINIIFHGFSGLFLVFGSFVGFDQFFSSSSGEGALSHFWARFRTYLAYHT